MRVFSNHYRRILEFALLAWLASVAGARGNGRLNTFPGGGWSPNGEWIALNIPERKELYIVSAKSGYTFLLMPVGMKMEMTGVFSSAAPTTMTNKPAENPTSASETPVRPTRQIPSAGTGRLAPLEWAPDSRLLAYTIERERRGVFQLSDDSVHDVPAAKPLPWAPPHRLDITFDYGHGSETNSERYVVRARRQDGSPGKEVLFETPAEMAQIGVTRRRAHFASPTGEFFLYPRQTGDGWRLMREPMDKTGVPAPVTMPAANPPYDWRFSADGRYLAVADAEWLTYGAMDAWAEAQRVPVKGMLAVAQWSPDARFLAFSDKQSLHVVARESNTPTRVSTFCSPRFWGWRGTRLYFGDAQTNPSAIYYVEAHNLTNVQQIVKAGNWQTAPREIGFSPDGRQVACLVANFDGSGRQFWQVWRHTLPRGRMAVVHQSTVRRLRDPKQRHQTRTQSSGVGNALRRADATVTPAGFDR